ncbi:MAG: EAL domain-containing protein [Myxococcota bacterium]|nr:EAL domain-containing protein [Myxococcota bacterium]
MEDIDTIVDEIATEMRLSSEMIDRRLAFLHLVDRDRELLKGRRGWFLQNADSILDAFFARFSASQDARQVMPGKHCLVSAMKDHLLHLFSGEYGVVHARRCFRTGVVHHKLGVTEELYVGAYSWLLDALQSAVHEQPEATPAKAADIVSALIKVVLFDLGLVLETYAHASHRTIEHMAKSDLITGLPNYNVLVEDLEERLQQCCPSRQVYAFFVGLDRFKAVNETLGHPIGDEILKQVALRLRAVMPAGFLLSRLGGDIFVIAAGGDADPLATPAFTAEILNTLQAPMDLTGFSVDISATIGVAVAEEPGVDAVSLMRQSEMAMYHAKAKQLPTTVFEIDMKRYSVAQLGIGTELRRAVDNNELILFYQPKIDVQTGQTVAVEALIRWMHPMKGFMPPNLFIPTAEQTVLIHEVTDWVLQAAISQASEWHRKGIDLAIAVNLAAPNLQNLKLPQQLETLLTSSGFDPAKLTLEITESGLMADPQRAHDVVMGLRDLGAKLSIDDFGTGYSSLAYLKTLPVDEVKIDQIFIFTMSEDENDDRIVRATIGLGHNLGLDVAAEGVENQETLDKLKRYGCDTVQGFFFSKPLPAYDLEVWLTEQHGSGKNQ